MGDGALTGGMAWEALNNIAADKKRRVVIVVNDNGRSYAPTVGGFADYLASLRPTIDSLRAAPAYEGTLDWWKRKLQNGGPAGQFTYKSLHAMKKGIKDWWAPQGMFEDLGMKYIGPVDGHNLQAMEHALSTAKNYAGPVIVHAMTEKGHGYAPGPRPRSGPVPRRRHHRPGDGRAHRGRRRASPGRRSSPTRSPTSPTSARTSSASPAPCSSPWGCTSSPHGTRNGCSTSASPNSTPSPPPPGMAFGGLHPVVAVYATFLNRAFDQLLMDVALHKAGVTVVLDRAGVTGPDGASHHGMWDMAMVQIVPGLHLAAPRDATRLREELREAVAVEDAPTRDPLLQGQRRGRSRGHRTARRRRGRAGPPARRLHRERRPDRQRRAPCPSSR